MNYQQIIDEIERESLDLRSRVCLDCTLVYTLDNAAHHLRIAQQRESLRQLEEDIEAGRHAAYNDISDVLESLDLNQERFAVQKLQNVLVYLEDPKHYAGQHALYSSLESEATEPFYCESCGSSRSDMEAPELSGVILEGAICCEVAESQVSRG